MNNVPVNSIKIDSSGFKWIGTSGGLILYDNFKWYHYPLFNGLAINTIIINNNKVTIGSSNGAYEMAIGDNEITLSESIFKTNTGSNSDTIFAFGYDSFDKKWSGSPDGLNYYDGTIWKRNQFIRNNLGGISDIRSMAFMNNDCFFGSYGKFLFHIKYGKKETIDAISGASQMIGGAENPIKNFNGELTTDTIYCVLAGSDSSLWFGSKEGLTRNKGETHVNNGVFEYFLRGHRVHSVLETHDNKIWAGTENGLYLKNGDVWINYNNSDGIAGNLILCIAEDKDLSIWIGTDNGISHFVNGSFRQPE